MADDRYAPQKWASDSWKRLTEPEDDMTTSNAMHERSSQEKAQAEIDGLKASLKAVTEALDICCRLSEEKNRFINTYLRDALKSVRVEREECALLLEGTAERQWLEASQGGKLIGEIERSRLQAQAFRDAAQAIRGRAGKVQEKAKADTDKAILAEREACAKVVEENADMFCDCMGSGKERPEDYAKELADKIRGRT